MLIPTLRRLFERGPHRVTARLSSEAVINALYVVISLASVLAVARDYYGSMQSQLLLSAARAGAPSGAEQWSAPLDDVFIHFDFARATARGYPFQWSEGNGYSSGGTSLVYPFVLALGYRLGFTGLSLMHWAAIVACLSVWGTLLACRRFLGGQPPLLAFLFPAALLSVGALNWSLFSGMEIALFLAAWSLCAICWLRLRDCPSGSQVTTAIGLGLASTLLVATRPEAAILVALFCLSALPKVAEHHDGTPLQRWVRLALVLTISAVPGALVIVAHAVANRLLTGDASAAGAIVKLELNHPYLNAQAVWDAWKFHFWYQFARVTNYHFSDRFWPVTASVVVSTGWLVWPAATFGLFSKRTRAMSAMLWATQLSFMAVVALNGQVRWQNERYTMPAVAWLLLNAALGLSVCANAAWGRWPQSFRAAPWLAFKKLGLPVLAGCLALAFLWGQRGPAQGQRWFFGRAARNILDQHVKVGRALRGARPQPQRVLLSDAGAIPYASDLPALDIIGLGGIAGLPFARASNLGVGAVVELIQRMAPATRPDVMALYPSWWGQLPLWFGTPVFEAPVRGNVICGARSKVVYRPDWSPLVETDLPAALQRQHVVVDLDLADYVSEKDAGAHITGTPGYVVMKLLEHPTQPLQQLFDAGRILPQGASLDFDVSGLRPLTPTRLIVRTVQTNPATLGVSAGDGAPAETQLPPSDSWREDVIPIEAAAVRATTHFQLNALEGESILYHLWVVQ